MDMETGYVKMREDSIQFRLETPYQHSKSCVRINIFWPIIPYLREPSFFTVAKIPHSKQSSMQFRGVGTGGAIATPIFLEIGKIFAFSTPNISRSK